MKTKSVEKEPLLLHDENHVPTEKQLQNENAPASKKDNKGLKELEEDIAKKEKSGPNLEGLSKIAAERKKLAYDFYKEHGPDLSHADIENHLKGINFKKPVKIVRVPPDGLGPEGNELYQYTKVNTEGKTLKGSYYSNNPKKTPNQLGVSDQYNVRDANWQQTDIVKTVNQERIIFDKSNPAIGLKSTAASIEDTWSLKDKSIFTTGGAEQIYIPKKH